MGFAPAQDAPALYPSYGLIADSTVKQPLSFRHATSPLLFAARGRRRPLHSHPLVRGRAERRVPVAPLGLMRCGLPQSSVHQDFRRRRASARRSACGVFSVACTSAMANGPITKINVPGRRDRVAAKHLAERVSSWSSVTLSRGSSIRRSAVSLPVAVLAQIRPARRQTSPMNRVTPHLRRPPHPAPRT
ncbi:hypothetical protein SAMN05216367_2438 [Tardiphaga sp. OK245]|nr:hypothetical protein SAMN05216367_2438 [Tardiphaga sp. OK245]